MSQQETSNSSASAAAADTARASDAPGPGWTARADLGAQFIVACEDLNDVLLRALLERLGECEDRSAALEYVDERGWTALGVAARAGDSCGVRLLLEAGSIPRAMRGCPTRSISAKAISTPRSTKN